MLIQHASQLKYRFEPPQRAIHTVVFHCSASNNPLHDDIEVVRKWHVEDNSWDDVGYHFFIKSNGELQYGRSLELTPAAQKGFNEGTITICLHGLHPEDFTAEQRKTVRELSALIDYFYSGQMAYINYRDRIRFKGHKDFDRNRLCPVFDYKRWLFLDEDGYIDEFLLGKAIHVFNNESMRDYSDPERGSDPDYLLAKTQVSMLKSLNDFLKNLLRRS